MITALKHLSLHLSLLLLICKGQASLHVAADHTELKDTFQRTIFSEAEACCSRAGSISGVSLVGNPACSHQTSCMYKVSWLLGLVLICLDDAALAQRLVAFRDWTWSFSR